MEISHNPYNVSDEIKQNYIKQIAQQTQVSEEIVAKILNAHYNLYIENLFKSLNII